MKMTLMLSLALLMSSCSSGNDAPNINFDVDVELPYDDTVIEWTDSEAQWSAFTCNITAEWRGVSDIIDGWDFSHPTTVRANPRGQINTETTTKYSDIKAATDVTLTKFARAHWDDLEPSEGVYDFSSLKEDIDEAIDEGFSGVVIRLYATVSEAYLNTAVSDLYSTYDSSYYGAPRWLLEKYPDIYIVEDDRESTSKCYFVDSYAIWDDRFHTHYLKFIKKLGESGILQMDGVAGCYVCAISESEGEEFWLSTETVAAAKANGGLTDEKMQTILKERFDAWETAAGADNRHKLIWVGSGEQEFLGDTDQIVTDYAVNEKGFGLRGGWIEVYLQKLISPYHGQYIDDEGYLATNEECSLLSNPSTINADEAEEYSTANATVFGDVKMNTYRYFEAMLRALQMRINMLWINLYSDEYTNFALTQFVANEMGCDVTDAPDAWVYLRQNNISRQWGSGVYEPCKNYERWLYQRDRDGGYQTQPTMPIDQDDQLSQWETFAPDGEKYNYTARRTDYLSENDKIGFAIDDRFISGNAPVVLKISYHDIGNVEWGVRYTTTDGSTQELMYKTVNSRNVKTISYFIKDADFSASDKEFDFELFTTNGDVAFSFVRVIKQ